MDHPNISSMKDIVCSQAQDPRTQKGEVYLVFDYMDHDLQGLLSQKIHYGPAEIKCLLRQILLGLEYLHKQGVMHRDIKGANLLLNNKGILKLTDFGLARKFDP